MFSSNASAVSDDANYIENVFSTWLYTGDGASQTINNGIDLAGKGGMVWMKNRTSVQLHSLCDTVTGAQKYLNSASTAAQVSGSTYLESFTSTGFNTGSTLSATGDAYASWTFREQRKFFDVVTWTGDGQTFRTVNHNLGAKPGFIICKCTSTTSDWSVLAKMSGGGDDDFIPLNLNSTAASRYGSGLTTAVSSTLFYTADLGFDGASNDQLRYNQNGATYVAYLFAHNAGGFGLTGTDNVISCGSWTGTGSTPGPVVTLGYEPQWVIWKRADAGTEQWHIRDVMRGMPVTASGKDLYADSSSAEGSTTNEGLIPTATGFQVIGTNSNANTNGGTYIYMAIRRGPMKVPTTGAQVYQNSALVNSSINFFADANETPRDVILTNLTDGSSVSDHRLYTKLIGYGLSGASKNYLVTSSTAAQSTDTSDTNNVQRIVSTTVLNDWLRLNVDGRYGALHLLRRAPGFMDTVCWTGDGTGAARNHNLGAYPELVISKIRSTFGNWDVQNNINPSAKQTGFLNTTGALSSSGATSPTATVFYPTNDSSGATYATYLFASCPGVSKVGSYTGNGSSQTINCGFTGGARFVLVKRTDSTGNWLMVDTARGLVSAGDPTMYLNSTAAEVTGVDWIDPDSSGFIVNQESTMNANVNTATYIFLAIA